MNSRFQSLVYGSVLALIVGWVLYDWVPYK